MTFGKSTKERCKWHTWFAWHPVLLDDGRWAWLERIERRRNLPRLGLMVGWWDYRLRNA